MMQDKQFDIAIVGAGIVGCITANLISHHMPHLKVVLINKQNPPAYDPQTDIDSRVYAINQTTKGILERLNLWSRVGGVRSCAYQSMCVWEDNIAQGLIFTAEDSGLEDLGYILEHNVLNHELFQQLNKAERVLSAQVTALRIDPHWATIDTTEKQIQAKLVIAADGAASTVRAMANIQVNKSAYLQSAIVANITSEKPHKNTAWQRFLTKGPLAFLPLADGRCSIVWSMPDQDLQECLSMNERDFVAELGRQSQYCLGEISAVTERRAFALQHLSAQTYVKPRLALIGDAAHVVHPLAGQGLNLGCHDAFELLGVLSRAGRQVDLGSLQVLRRYQRRCQPHNEIMSTSFGLLNEVFAQQGRSLPLLRQQSLQFVNQTKILKGFFARQAIGKI